ncbi:hypothetical protein I3760_08G172500 [Carya illinoinensis]|nr:hypothetical protein I3760_08G172500 [Carya illinoinensis]
MRAFLKSVDERVWASVTNGWKQPVVVIEGVQTTKCVENYSRDEVNGCSWNSKNLNAMFMAVSQEEFKRISMCENCKEAWDILEVTHEGTKAVKNSKLQMLTTNFEELRIKDDETFDGFYCKLNDIVNSHFNLGDRIPEDRIVRKVLRSLPERFRPKVTAIEESKDLDNMRIEELESGESSDELAMSDKEIAFYAKKFRKMFAQKNPRQENRRFKGFNGGSSLENREGSYKRETRVVKDNIQCHECHGFGHIRFECANYKKAKEKANADSLTDSESESSDSQESSPRRKNLNYMAFTSSVVGKSHSSESVVEIESVSENESGDEDDLKEIYEKLYKECVKLRKLNKAHIEEIDLCKRENEGLQGKLREVIGLTDELQKRNVTLEDKVTTHENELTLLNTKLQKFSIGTNQLDKLLSLGKSSSDKSGLGYFEENPDAPSSLKAFGKNVKTTVFVPEMTEKRKAHPSEKGKKPLQVQKSVPPPKRQGARNMSPICHHCGKLGHIRPNCFKLMSHFVHAPAFVNSRTAYPSGRGKNYMNNPKNVSTFLRQRVHKASPVCHHCGKIGHIRPNCFELTRHTKRIEKPFSRKWIPRWIIQKGKTQATHGFGAVD